MGIFTVIMGATMGGLADVIKGNETVLQMAGMNNSVRAGMDLMVRDLLQVGSGLPASHSVTIPSGVGAVAGADSRAAGDGVPDHDRRPDAAGRDAVRRPGPDHRRRGHRRADRAHGRQRLPRHRAEQRRRHQRRWSSPGTNLSTGPDRVTPGQLMMISKGSFNTLVQVTAVDAAARRLTFADGDSLNLNQSGAGPAT